MKNLESLKSEKFLMSEDEKLHITGGCAGPSSSWREVDTTAPDCSVSCDSVLVDICWDL